MHPSGWCLLALSCLFSRFMELISQNDVAACQDIPQRCLCCSVVGSVQSVQLAEGLSAIADFLSGFIWHAMHALTSQRHIYWCRCVVYTVPLCITLGCGLLLRSKMDLHLCGQFVPYLLSTAQGQSTWSILYMKVIVYACQPFVKMARFQKWLMWLNPHPHPL